jgi:hypothetical protein
VFHSNRDDSLIGKLSFIKKSKLTLLNQTFVEKKTKKKNQTKQQNNNKTQFLYNTDSINYF